MGDFKSCNCPVSNLLSNKLAIWIIGGLLGIIITLTGLFITYKYDNAIKFNKNEISQLEVNLTKLINKNDKLLIDFTIMHSQYLETRNQVQTLITKNLSLQVEKLSEGVEKYDQ